MTETRQLSRQNPVLTGGMFSWISGFTALSPINWPFSIVNFFKTAFWRSSTKHQQKPQTQLFPKIEVDGAITNSTKSKTGFPTACATDAGFDFVQMRNNQGNVVGWDVTDDAYFDELLNGPPAFDMTLPQDMPKMDFMPAIERSTKLAMRRPGQQRNGYSPYTLKRDDRSDSVSSHEDLYSSPPQPPPDLMYNSPPMTEHSYPVYDYSQQEYNHEVHYDFIPELQQPTPLYEDFYMPPGAEVVSPVSSVSSQSSYPVYDYQVNVQMPPPLQQASPESLGTPISQVSTPASSTAKNPFVCLDCGAAFRIKGYLTRHLKKHANKKAYNCPFYNCDAETPCHPSGGFSRRDTYKTHLKARHFVYPSGTRSEQRAKTGGACGGCGSHFDNNETWVEEHIQKGLCSGLVTNP